VLALEEEGFRNEAKLSEAEASRRDQDLACCDKSLFPDADMMCRADGSSENLPARDRDPDYGTGCEYARFISGRDETALNSDMGLMYSFDVDKYGFPSGCVGLPETFVPNASGGDRFSDVRCSKAWKPDAERDDRMRKGCPAECPKNDYRYPTDTKTLSEHFEHFADHQNDWIEEFLLTMERMIKNRQADLVESWPAMHAA